MESDDESLLAWAAEQDRALLTHDVSTITAFAYRRLMKATECLVSSKSAARSPFAQLLRTFSC